MWGGPWLGLRLLSNGNPDGSSERAPVLTHPNVPHRALRTEAMDAANRLLSNLVRPV